MATILEQDEINKLIFIAEELQAKQSLANSAKDKVREMYLNTCSYHCTEDMDSLQSIGLVIDDISRLIQPDSIYFPSYNLLKLSYEFKLLRL